MKTLLITLTLLSSLSTLAVGESATEDCARTIAGLDSRIASSEAKNALVEAPKQEVKPEASSGQVRN